MAIHNKLIRDKLPQILKQKGLILQTRVLNKEEYLVALMNKLKEESNEASCAQGNKADLKNELGDILDVVDSIIIANNFDSDEIHLLRQQKTETRGGFRDRIFLIEIAD